MTRDKNTRKELDKKISMHFKMIIFIGVFTLFAVVTVWVVQVFMSDVLYENVKRHEIEATTEYIMEQINGGGEDIGEKIEIYADQNNICIGLYRIEEHEVVELYTAIVFVDNIIYNASDTMLRSIYNIAEEQGGEYSAEFGFDFVDNSDKNVENTENVDVITFVHAHTFSDELQNKYMLLLNSDLTPLNSAKKTFGAQFRYTIILLIIFSIVMVYLLSRYISRPLKNMTASARKLAKGDYDVEFNAGGGYLEIVELGKTLNYAASELAKNDNLQKELIGNISHDLRTPLTMIKGYSEMMRDIPGENTPENIQAIIDETTRLSELVNDLLDLSKIEGGAGRFEAERFELDAAVSEVIGRFDRMNIIKDYNIKFESDGKAEVYADRSMILQVIYNLVSNAVNYSGDDKFIGVTQTVVKDENGREAVRLSVTDHGEGIKKEDLPLIWDRYYKVEGVHRRATVGTGIGLSIVKKVLERHGAAYGVTSAVGVGSTFWFELPLADNN